MIVVIVIWREFSKPCSFLPCRLSLLELLFWFPRLETQELPLVVQSLKRDDTTLSVVFRLGKQAQIIATWISRPAQITHRGKFAILMISVEIKTSSYGGRGAVVEYNLPVTLLPWRN